MLGMVIIALKIIVNNGKDLRREFLKGRVVTVKTHSVPARRKTFATAPTPTPGPQNSPDRAVSQTQNPNRKRQTAQWSTWESRRLSLP